MKPVIEVNNLSKSYIINHKNKASYNTIKDDFSKLLKHPFKKDGAYDKQETFWALNDVSFNVNKGEIFGIIGRNGSGKSTLLKILSRIVEPTKGNILMTGRTASLLEVGTGFNPELTGRENIFFNGSMLGMSRREITSKFNDIVDFSEVEKFLDTPVKFYSSGMYVRLAFSVAAHLEPDILILDEVLAVGDAAFQKKSLNKILETMNDGRTVLFVSHSMAAVQQLCTRGMLLKNGHADYIGPIGKVAEKYTNLMNELQGSDAIQSTWSNDGKTTNEEFVPINIYLSDSNSKKISSAVPSNKEYYVNIEAEIVRENKDYTIGYAIYNENRTLIYMTYESDMQPSKRSPLKKGLNTLRSRIPADLLNAGTYKIVLAVGVYNKYWIFDPDTSTPSIQVKIEGGLVQSPYWRQARSGMIAPAMEWEVI